MAHPKKRMSPVRSGNRRRTIGITLPATIACTNCKSLMVKHQVCVVCGYYKGREVISKALPALKRS